MVGLGLSYFLCDGLGATGLVIWRQANRSFARGNLYQYNSGLGHGAVRRDPRRTHRPAGNRRHRLDARRCLDGQPSIAPSLMNQAQQSSLLALRERLTAARSVVVLTGAGISADS